MELILQSPTDSSIELQFYVLKKFQRCLFVHLSFLSFLLWPLVFVYVSSSSGIWSTL